MTKRTSPQAAALSGLLQHGFCVIPDVVGDDMLARLRSRFDSTVLANAPQENFGDAGAFVVADYHDPVMVDLLSLGNVMDLFKAWGFSDPRLHNFYVSTKPPGALALSWHSDLFYKHEAPKPTELFLIYYLQNTTLRNGCLRVVPGSHLWSDKKRQSQHEDAALRDDEVDVPVQAGSLFVGDRRILHATHANNSDQWRTCLTIAYAPQFDTLAPGIKTMIAQNQCLPTQEQIKNPTLHNIDPRLTAILPLV